MARASKGTTSKPGRWAVVASGMMEGDTTPGPGAGGLCFAQGTGHRASDNDNALHHEGMDTGCIGFDVGWCVSSLTGVWSFVVN